MSNKKNFREYNQDQLFFTTIDLKKLIPAEHPAVIINEIVERLNLEKLYEYYSNEGNPSYHPKLQLKIIFYGYYTGNMSCRKIWDNVIYRADFMYLAGGGVPDFRTINSFRIRHIDILPDLFTQIVILCKELDLIGFENLAIDGEMIKGNASFNKNKSMEMLKEEYEKTRRGLKHLLEKEINEDFTEEVKKEKGKKIKKKMEKIEQMKENLEKIINENKDEKRGVYNYKGSKEGKRREEYPEKIKVNMTDKDAIALKHKDNRILPSYNHQSAVDERYGVVCAINTKNTPDHPEDLFKIVDKAKENTGGEFKNILADCAFGNYEVYEEIEEGKKEEEYYIPDERYSAKKKNRYQNGKYDIEHFKKNLEGNMICPEGYLMESKGIIKKGDKKIYLYRGKDCDKCLKHDDCTRMKFRQIQVDTRVKYQDKMREKLDTDRGRLIYSKRSSIVENVHGDDQKNRGWIQHHLRGLFKAETEFIFIRIATNLRKIVNYGSDKLWLMPKST